jgi:hypothetical protein
MDEECLANYLHGGIDCSDISDFDKWIAMPENRDRILPFPRTVVAFRIRRNKKDRSDEKFDNPFVKMMVLMSKEEADKKTFLYLRNGENLYRLDCRHDFGEKLFPDNVVFRSQKPWWNAGSSNRDMGSFITDADYHTRKAKQKRLKKDLEEASKTHEEAQQELHLLEEKEPRSKPKYYGEKGSPEWERLHEQERKLYFEVSDIRLGIRENKTSGYRQFSPSDVYYDDMNKQLEDMIRRYNRVAYIMQGLFDRSTVFHPHPPVQLWTPEGMNAAIKMVRDEDRALHADEKPDIEAYLEENRKHLKEGCHTIGQEDFWAEREAEKENKRTANCWRSETTYHDRFHPYGNPGPGYIAKVVKMTKRSHKCTYEWNRERQTEGWSRDGKYHRYGDPIPCKIQVPPERLFVVEAYTPGDYKKFFADPRTRSEYLEWAPLLLAAEEWHAGNMAEGVEYVRYSFKQGMADRNKED